MDTLNTAVKASMLSGVQETTLTLANLNSDFSLYRVEAPTEYQGLGKTLSKQRREAAEIGSEHVFARKLAAFFLAQLLPSTPSLLAAYSSRASEIAKSPAANPQGSREDGLFQNWIGADATSIWAAATSRPGAIAVHLACMLARLWSTSEVTTIWDEIIESRKQGLANMGPMEPQHFTTIAASRIDISRGQMASWDASARTWLSIADGA